MASDSEQPSAVLCCCQGQDANKVERGKGVMKGAMRVVVVGVKGVGVRGV